ncbi:MAG TPA: hypothetical protein VMC09_04185 [Anaerolineales bacterium]|nr:hypothetical protein [Anaerolineales bacterium]
MTQRSIPSGATPKVLIKAGTDVTVKGVDGDMVTAETESRWGLKVEKHSEAEFARARAAIGEVVLFDWHFKRPNFQSGDTPEEIIEVQFGGSGEVLVPFGSHIKVYAGKSINVSGIQGQVDAFSGLSLNVQGVRCLGNASAGWSMNVESQTILGQDAIYTAGSDLRFQVAGLTSLRLRVKDIGGYWEARIGAGERSVYLKSGGDVTFVTDQKVEPQPPGYILGKIEKPAA